MAGNLVVYKIFEGVTDAEYENQELVWDAVLSLEAHKAKWWPGIVSVDSVGHTSVEVSYMKPHPIEKPGKLEKSRVQIMEG